MEASFASHALALGAALLAGGALYVASPRQRVVARPLPIATAVVVAALLMGLGFWLLAGHHGVAPAFFAVLVMWMLAMVACPWLAGWLLRRRPVDGA
ncbi:hypothetical protein [Uliginosibacterium sp. H1]|uniref:hypothetical protein n=1 Tax=Uliginosibacterium sp. H1 TaxID=3114757 RepID=UPI002E17C603|nr:hypothetical protein [Uliginosibacterium sp. H1]